MPFCITQVTNYEDNYVATMQVNHKQSPMHTTGMEYRYSSVLTPDTNDIKMSSIKGSIFTENFNKMKKVETLHTHTVPANTSIATGTNTAYYIETRNTGQSVLESQARKTFNIIQKQILEDEELLNIDFKSVGPKKRIQRSRKKEWVKNLENVADEDVKKNKAHENAKKNVAPEHAISYSKTFTPQMVDLSNPA